ncbi:MULTISPECIES: helix-turn-helix domain-containing protein [Bacillaceae]|uniref:helix-turn-helix domain-containing protein n=1 Tax=Bacillaceae TaxID=186817 RepID=UPI000A93CE7A|nr:MULTISPECIES: helix-turn-helix domain-containing protein [Bacillaceae]MED4476070.1 helix-turn-helix domain-containing protein [Oceanobacillus caeni]
MDEKPIIKVDLNEESLKKLYLVEVKKHLAKLEADTFLMDSKQLCKMLNLSWPTIEKLFLRDPNFPSIRVGKKWVFNRKEVEEYINCWSVEIREQGGEVEI